MNIEKTNYTTIYTIKTITSGQEITKEAKTLIGEPTPNTITKDNQTHRIRYGHVNTGITCELSHEAKPAYNSPHYKSQPHYISQQSIVPFLPDRRVLQSGEYKTKRYIMGIKDEGKTSVLGVTVDEQIKGNIEEFLQSTQGRFICAQLYRSKNNPEIDRILAGAVFERIGSLWLRDQIKNDGKALLSPREVFEVWKELYPNKKIEIHGGINPSVRGTSMPDGLIIEERKDYIAIECIVDYKNLPIKFNRLIHNRTVEQSDHYRPNVFAKELRDSIISERIGRLIHKLRPELPSKPVIVDPNLKLMYVIPQKSELNIPNSIIKHAPVTSPQIYNLKKSLLEKAEWEFNNRENLLSNNNIKQFSASNVDPARLELATSSV